MNKTLKEIVENFITEAAKGTSAKDVEVAITKAILEYAKSIVPEENDPYEHGDPAAEGWRDCRREILSTLSKEEELLNKQNAKGKDLSPTTNPEI